MAVGKVAPAVGVQAACKALVVPRASFYRARLDASTALPPMAEAPAVLAHHPRALLDAERAQVLDLLHSDRFVDCPPEVVHATLLDEGSYLCSPRTMYRILHDHKEVRERRDQLRRPVYTKP